MGAARRIGRRLATTGGVAALVSALTACAGLDPASRLSAGTYRIPYAEGTRVRVSRDARTHTPPGRLDLVGVGAARYRVVAAAPGIVRYVVDEFSERQDSRTAVPCNNNYVWLEHANGEWTKYSHLRTHSARRDAGLKVGDSVEAASP